ncbi:hypothetical protein ASZ90_015874 [hydrocarbon metagenome]|uniref:Uncharacterized protein n=1 Tax=hydrocarbon metagenome TaxID=938273 RepID=A0A0W8F0W4_9ZZZZ
MTNFLDNFRKRLGWCPGVGPVRTHGYAKAETSYGTDPHKRSPGPAPSPESAGTAGSDRPGYRDNLLLILIALAWLFPVVYQREFLPIIIVLSVAAMYVDARNINAGGNFGKETLFGNIVAWRPLTWGAATLVGGIIIMAIYIFHRKEIYNANYRHDPQGCEIVD